MTTKPTTATIGALLGRRDNATNTYDYGGQKPNKMKLRENPKYKEQKYKNKKYKKQTYKKKCQLA